jgi:hypothetical protein
MTTVASISAKADVASLAVRSTRPRRRPRVRPRRCREDPAEFSVASLEVGREPVVAVGEACQFVVTDDLDRARQVARPDAVDCVDDGPERSQELCRERECCDDREGEQDRQCEEEDLGERLVGTLPTEDDLEGEDDDAEDGERDDGGEEQGQRQARPEAQPRGPGARFVGLAQPGQSSSRGIVCHPDALVTSLDATSGSRRPDRLDMDGLVRIDLHLLAEPAHRDPDVGRVGVLGLGPAAGEERLGRDGLAEVGGEGIQEA